MKMTVELPESLMRSMKIRAAREQKKLKDAVTEWIRRGMETPQSRKAVRLPKVAKLRGRGPLTAEEIEAAINWGRE